MRPPIRSNLLWGEALALMEQADRLHRQFFQPSRALKGPCWEPPVDVMETDQRVLIIVALPGVSTSEVNIVVDGDVVSVVGERSLPSLPGASIRHLEIPYGHFERRIQLPSNRNFEIEHRELADGCLRLVLRKL